MTAAWVLGWMLLWVRFLQDLYLLSSLTTTTSTATTTTITTTTTTTTNTGDAFRGMILHRVDRTSHATHR